MMAFLFFFFFFFALNFHDVTNNKVLAFSTLNLLHHPSRFNTCSLSSSASDDISNDYDDDDYNNQDRINNNNNNNNEWSVTDDWESLSSGLVASNSIDSSNLFNKDFADYAAREMEKQYQQQMMMSPQQQQQQQQSSSKEDIWISDAIDEIHNSFSTLPLYDTGFEEYTVQQQDDDDNNNNNNFASTMDQEIAMLVRCNEHPEELLIYEGRALAPLTDKESNDPFQLVEQQQQQATTTTTNPTTNYFRQLEQQPAKDDDETTAATKTNPTTNYFRMTPFLKESVSIMFHKHAISDPSDGVLSLDRKGVAKWMTKCLKSEEKIPVSAHDNRVLETISKFGKYGSGRLLQADFEQLYYTTIVGDTTKVNSGQVSPSRHFELRKPFLDAVWRDIRSHGILSPIEKERELLVKKIQASEEKSTTTTINDMAAATTIMDECEILDWDFNDQRLTEEGHADKRQARKSKSSHKGVELASDNKTPLWMRDGKFVFIDEESCIGCMQCVNVSPASFMMLDSGRARTFQQRSAPDVDQAVASCPVNCMHPVTYRELQEFETARDDGDGRTDHKYLNHQQGHTPLFVAGIDSDRNRRSSWYHTLKHRCLVSSECPQKGCYDCPKFSNPGDNPYFKQNHKAAEHVRALYFSENGDGDIWRKTADL